MTNNIPESQPYKVWVIEILLEASSSSFFALEISNFNEKDYLLSSQGRVVVFSEESIIPFLEKKLEIDLRDVKLEKLVSLRLDVEEIFQYLQSKRRIDWEDNVLNFLNFSFDFLSACGIELSAKQKYLVEFADFLTFSNSPKKFLKENRISKDSLEKELDFLVEKIKANCNYLLNTSQMFDFGELKIDSSFYLGKLRPFLSDKEIDINDLRG